MNSRDDYLRRHRQRPPQEPEEAPKKSVPLVSQGARSGGVPRREVTPDDLIRAAAGRSSALLLSVNLLVERIARRYFRHAEEAEKRNREIARLLRLELR